MGGLLDELLCLLTPLPPIDVVCLNLVIDRPPQLFHAS